MASTGMTVVVSASPSHAEGHTGLTALAAPSTGDGWYHAPITVSTTFVVDNSWADERVVNVSCYVNGDLKFSDDDISRDYVRALVDISQSSPGPWGTDVQCTARYERRPNLFFPWTFYREVTANGTFRVDLDGPVNVHVAPDRLPDHDDWYTASVAFTVNGADTLSGIGECGEKTGNFITSTTGRLYHATGPQNFTFGCRDRVGHETLVTVPLKMDGTPPTLSPTVPNTLLVGSTASATPHASDDISGIESQTCGPLETISPGIGKTVTCRATNGAGLTSVATATYNVEYSFDGFAAPVSTTDTNVIKAGQTLPLKFRLSDAKDAGINDLTDVTVTAASATCDLGATEDPTSETTAGNSGLQNLGNGNYLYNWKTPKSYANSCKHLTVTFADGGSATIAARFIK